MKHTFITVMAAMLFCSAAVANNVEGTADDKTTETTEKKAKKNVTYNEKGIF